MLEKNNKISVLTKMIGIGDEKTPQLIVPQNSLTNFHARMGLSEKSVNMAGSGAQAPTISCPHCQNMAKNFLYLESLIRANGSPKNKCSLCSSTLRYVEYVNKSILDVFAKNASIIEAAQKYSEAKPRFRMPKLMSRVSRLAGGGKKSHAMANNDSTYHHTTSAASATLPTTNAKRNLTKKAKTKSSDLKKSSIFKNISKTADKSRNTEKSKKDTTTKSKNSKSSNNKGSKSSLKTGKSTGARLKAHSFDSLSERSAKTKKSKLSKSKKSSNGSSTALKKQSSKIKRKTGVEMNAFAA